MKLQSIQYLRGIAACAVVFKHASHPGGAFEAVLDGGVDLFFVISGFVMVVSTHDRNMTAGEFIAKRCRRILPMWWLTLILVGLLGLGQGGIWSWLLSLALIPTRIESGVGGVYWGLGWTLVFEAVFYVLFALGLLLKSKWLIFGLLPSLAVVGVLFGRSANPLLNDFLDPMLLEFAFGAAIAYFVVRGIRPPMLLVPLGAALLGVGAAFGVLSHARAVTVGLPMALMLAGVAAWMPPIMKPLKLLGDSSYSIYLLHYVAILLLWRIVPVNSWWLLTASAGILFGIFGFFIAERPLLNALSPKRETVGRLIPRW